MPKNPKDNHKYKADEITVLEGLEPHFMPEVNSVEQTVDTRFLEVFMVLVPLLLTRFLLMLLLKFTKMVLNTSKNTT
jgi:hypothetical protein